jgi:outer membrane protein OmpA-like peptidoglycan-associated protein
MRFLWIAAAFALSAAAPAYAQTTEEMNRAESALRSDLAPSGVAVERVAPDQILLRMPSDITFDFDRANVRREFIPRVRDLARTLNTYPSMSVGIVGHADALGSDAYNQELSERRAHSVGAALTDFGVTYRRINASGMGEMAPVDSNATEWGRARNRRVEIRLIAKPKD